MIAEFRLPDLGEGLPEAEIVQWMVGEGDEVALNQTIAEVETAKAVVEIPSPYAGIVRDLHADAGAVVAVGAPLVTFAVPGEDAEPDGGEPSVVVETGIAPVEVGDRDDVAVRAEPNLVGYGAVPSSGSRPHRRARVVATAPLDVDGAAPRDVVHSSAADRPEATRAEGVAARAIGAPAERPRSTPPVRKRAKDLGIDLTLVAARHPGAVIGRRDVEDYAAHAASTGPLASTVPPAASADRRERVTRTPIRGVRKQTAAAMVRSAFTAPHATTFLTIDVTATTGLVASLKDDRALDGHRIGVLAIVAKAVCLALGRTPALNSRWDDAAAEIVEHHYVNLGIAAATDRGLVVPVIADAERLDLVDLADAIAELAATARAGRTAPAAMQGGTFSITNVGVFGVDAGTPILNPGEAGILAVGAVRRTPWEHAGEIALRDVVTLSLSFDHRLVDGAEAARFLADVAGVLREPGRAMLLR